MSFREKSAWACLITLLAVQVPYFLHVLPLFARGSAAPAELWGPFVGAIVAQVVLLAAIHIGLARQASREPRDERDAAIDSRATRRAYALLSVEMCLLMFSTLWFGPAVSITALGQFVLAGWVLAEVARYLSQLWDYRREVHGAAA